IYYDDQSNPATVPGIFTKLLDVDKVDLVCGDYGTNLLAPAMPVVIQHNMTFFALFGLDVNREFQYPRYFAMQPAGGPNPPAAEPPPPPPRRDAEGPRRRKPQNQSPGRPARQRGNPRTPPPGAPEKPQKNPGRRPSAKSPPPRTHPTTRGSCAGSPPRPPMP